MIRSLTILVLMAFLAVPTFAANETLNQTVPVVISFKGGAPWGDNPIQFIDNRSGEIAFIGNTSSRNIKIEPDRGYVMRVEPAGFADGIHSPDSALVGCTEWAGRNPIGYIGFSLIFGAFISAYRRKNGGK